MKCISSDAVCCGCRWAVTWIDGERDMKEFTVLNCCFCVDGDGHGVLSLVLRSSEIPRSPHIEISFKIHL